MRRLQRAATRGRPISARVLQQAVADHDASLGPCRIHGARVAGPVDLSHRQLEFGLEFVQCRFSDPLDLRGLQAVALDLRGSSVPALLADGLAVDGDVRLSGCVIGTAPGEPMALGIEAAVVRDGVQAPRRVSEPPAEAPLRLADARIAGNLTAEELHLYSSGLWSLFAPRLRIDGALQGRGLTATGAVYLRDVRVAHAVYVNGARMGGIDATGLSCGRGFYADWGFCSHGQVLLRGAAVESVVTFHDATLAAPHGELILSRLTTSRLRLDLRVAPHRRVVLRDARVGALVDDSATWPADGRLDIEGLVYQRLGSTTPLSLKDRLAWLALDHEAGVSVFEQLAASYQAAGDERAVRAVRHARERHLRRSDRLTGRIWGAVQDVLFGYGYAPRRALLWLLALVAAGSSWFSVHPPTAVGGSGQRTFDPVLYCLDLLIPVVSLGYRSAFDPAGWDKVVAVFLIISGWVLATAVISGASRALGRG
ncbi:hypothetical protein ACFWFH_07890 [Streptomyces coelicoflavus]|uniref:hypothetical protein n=1 Tax=Streptomyces TaxID=1883 RepID=UPI0012920162|nr:MULTISPECIES: hypothetical protein [Streptomyces]MCX5036467.1 hypothetical protein [Streptomyces coelicoflavus]QFX82675.1 hypothetical protein GEV49_18405 [Streptomyces sp. SYP-A7193]